MRYLALLLIMLCACNAGPDPAVLRASLTADSVAQIRVPVIFVQVPDRQLAATLVPSGQNGPVRSWGSRDGVQLSYDLGVLVATRGLGHDLMAADVGGTLAALRGAPMHYARLLSTINGAYQTVIQRHDCVMTREGARLHEAPLGPVHVTRYRESCNGARNYENIYHVAADDTVWWSRQWVPNLGSAVETERIKR
ncbi:YjbF family lipoprotein [Loktanella agnita]|uniref:YjbF family lipoprotein n=1 Tax=Loktanella agnita TaxID=287097 RepID=UPI003985F64F